MWRTSCCLWVLVLMMVALSALLHSAAADDDFCGRPANMDLCWWNNNYKRYLRFGRGDPFLRFGRSRPESWPFTHFQKREEDPDSLEKYLQNGGYLRFGRSLPMLAFALRKRRDVRSAPSSAEVQREARSVKDGGFLRFGRPQTASSAAQDPCSQQQGKSKKSDVDLPFGGNKHYLRFGKRSDLREARSVKDGGFLRFGRPQTASSAAQDPCSQQQGKSKKSDVDLPFGGNKHYLRFGKRNDLREARSVKDGGFLRFGRPQTASSAAQDPCSQQQGKSKKSDVDLPFGGNKHYLRFGKRSDLMFDRYVHLGKRAAETMV